MYIATHFTFVHHTVFCPFMLRRKLDLYVLFATFISHLQHNIVCTNCLCICIVLHTISSKCTSQRICLCIYIPQHILYFACTCRKANCLDMCGSQRVSLKCVATRTNSHFRFYSGMTLCDYQLLRFYRWIDGSITFLFLSLSLSFCLFSFLYLSLYVSVFTVE